MEKTAMKGKTQMSNCIRHGCYTTVPLGQKEL